MANDNKTVEQVCEMSLDFAINHAQEAGERLVNKTGCESCGKEHLQLAEWLRELKEARKIIAAKDDERLTVSANYESVIAAKDRIIEAKDAEIERLRAAIKPVLEVRLVDESEGRSGLTTPCAVCDWGIGGCEEDCEALAVFKAAKECQRIYKAREAAK